MTYAEKLIRVRENFYKNGNSIALGVPVVENYSAVKIAEVILGLTCDENCLNAIYLKFFKVEVNESNIRTNLFSKVEKGLNVLKVLDKKGVTDFENFKRLALLVNPFVKISVIECFWECEYFFQEAIDIALEVCNKIKS